MSRRNVLMRVLGDVEAQPEIDIAVLEAQLFAPCGHGFTEFLEGLHLMFTSKN